MRAFGKLQQRKTLTEGGAHNHAGKKASSINPEEGMVNCDNDLGMDDLKELTYYENSSFGIFHIDSSFRRLMLKLTEEKDVYKELMELRN